jgi:hypothetical protein
MASYRMRLIKSELNKRNRNHSNENSPTISNNEISDEDKRLAASTSLKDPFNKKIHSLTIKSRDNWMQKMYQYLVENTTSTTEGATVISEIDQKQLCIELEYNVLINSKNMILYQANCMKKINEFRKYTKENRSFFNEYSMLNKKEIVEGNFIIEI